MPTNLTTEKLRELHAWWMQGVPTEIDTQLDEKIKAGGESGLPNEPTKRWFMGGEEVDAKCRSDWKWAVEEAVKVEPTTDLLSLVEKPDDAVSLIALLDQMPRNIYRGEVAKFAYNVCDPKARELSHIFAEKYNEERKIWNHIQQWQIYLMPLMHSESLEDHHLIAEKISYALDTSESESEKAMIEYMQNFEEKHAKVIEKFGRYPSRNAALGRKNTPEEAEFLKNGPGW